MRIARPTTTKAWPAGVIVSSRADGDVPVAHVFHYHFINAQGTFEEVEQNILASWNRARWKSRTSTASAASRYSEITHARQELVVADAYELSIRTLRASRRFTEKSHSIVIRHAISASR